MKKRVCALFLTAVMLLGILPASVWASDSPEPVHLAAFSSAVTVDGSLSETGWLTYGGFGALWDQENLYLAVEATEAELELNGCSLQIFSDGTVSGTLAEAADVAHADALEIKVPFSAVGLALHNYFQTVPLTLTAGDTAYDGLLGFNGLIRSASNLLPADFNVAKGSNLSGQNGWEAADGGFRLYDNYLEDGSAKGGGRAYMIKNSLAAYTNRTETIWTEMDLRADSLPVVTAAKAVEVGRSSYGFNIIITDNTNRCLTAAVARTEEGLVFTSGSLKTAFAAVDIDRGLGETFHLALGWTPDDRVLVYVDGVQVADFSGTIVQDAAGVWWGTKTTLCLDIQRGTAAPASAADNMDVTVTNIAAGTVKYFDVLDSLTETAILGSNPSLQTVSRDLNLMTQLDNGQLPPMALVWETSDPETVSADGRVTCGETEKSVTLTAALAADPTRTKTFEAVVVPAVIEAMVTDTPITLDGYADETGWLLWNSFRDDPDSRLSLQWRASELYLFAAHSGADTLTITLSGQQSTVDLTDGTVTENCLNLRAAVSETGAELVIPMENPLDYNMTAGSFEAVLTTNGEAASLEAFPVELILTGDTAYPIEAFAGMSGPTFSNGVLTYRNTGSLQYAYRDNLSMIDHSRNLRLSQTLRLENLPVSSGDILSYASANGYYFWISTSSSRGIIALANIYNSGSSLKLRIGRMSAAASTDVIDLGVGLGETFRLSCVWGADGTYRVYVNDVLKGTVANVGYTENWCGNQCVQFRCSNISGATVTVSDISIAYEAYASIAEEITAAALFGQTDLNHVQSNLNMPTVFSSPYLGQVALTWETSDESILAADGTVTRPAGKVGKPVDLTLYVGGRKLWTEEVFVDPADLTPPASPTVIHTAFSEAAITVDGSIADEGWLLNTVLYNTDHSQLGRFGAQWQEDGVYLAVNTGSAATLSVSLAGKTAEVDLTAMTASGTLNIAQMQKFGSIVELKVLFSDLDVAVEDYNQEIPVTVGLDAVSVSGTLKLTSVDWFVTDNSAHRMPVGSKGSYQYINDGLKPTENQGVTQTDDGWYFYDLYDADGVNPTTVRSTLAFLDNAATYDPLDEQDKTVYVEFDVRPAAMPVYEVQTATGWDKLNYFPSYGMNWCVSAGRNGAGADSVAFGLLNTTQGMVLVGQSNGSLQTIVLNRQVGDLFRIGTAWQTDGDVIVYLDGVQIAVLERSAAVRNSYGGSSLIINSMRSETAAQSRADNLEIYVTNLAMGESYDDSILDSLTWDTIRGENTDPLQVSTALTLPQTMSTPQLTTPRALTWHSSDETVVALDGTVTIPAGKGKAVTLTAALEDGRTKEFILYIPGLQPDTSVLVAVHDTNPATGAGVPMDSYAFTLDTNNNSIIAVLPEKQTVNVVRLTDSDASARFYESTLSLWISDDNVTYTEIKDFKLLHQGENWYLYDFSAEAVYVKVHSTYYDGFDCLFTNDHTRMISAYAEAIFGTGGGVYETKTTVTVTNEAAETVYDRAFRVDMAATEDLRVYLGDELLYHCVEDGTLVVRVPQLAAGERAVLTVLSGNEAAMDISNRENVYEVVHGTREVVLTDRARWLHTLEDGTMLNVSALWFEEDQAWKMGRTFSYDGGRTWTEPEKLECCEGFMTDGGGFVTDSRTGRIIYQGHNYVTYVPGNKEASDCSVVFIYSDDNGITWHRLAEVETEEPYALSYADIVELRCNDGEGPNVDFVLPCPMLLNDTETLCCKVAYTTDGGLSWQYSNAITYGDLETGHEGGVSEGTILEREDGVLVLLARNQHTGVDHFAKSYSYDHGITWTDPAELSAVYAPNTQPMLYDYNGADLLLWGGNNALGGTSYRRTPMSLAVSYDGMETFPHVQDLFAKYSLQGLTSSDMSMITNPMLRKSGKDDLVITWAGSSLGGSPVMIISDFTEYFYRTKGAYDSFEHGTVKYEGWAATAGSVTLSQEEATDGSASLKLGSGSSAARSITSLQTGRVSMDLWLDADGECSVELQTAYSNVYGFTGPLGFSVKDGSVTLLGQEATSGLTVNPGWNTVEITMDLPGGTASITVNGETVSMPVNTAIGDYVCFANLINNGSAVLLDQFLAESAVDAQIPAATVEPIDIAGTTMTLGNDLALNFMVKTSEITGTGWYAEIVHGDKVTTIEQSEWVVSGNYTRISYRGLAAKQMVDEVVIIICDAKGNALATKTDSIRGYAMRMFGKSKPAFDTVLADMLNYGAAAQVQFNYKTDDPANGQMTEEQEAKATASVEMTNIRETANGYLGTTLELESNILLNFFYSKAYVGKTATVSYTDHYGVAHNYDVEIAASGNYGKVSVDQLVISDCSVKITVTVDGASVIDSVESYCARMTDLTLREPLMKFATSARTYFSK